VPDLSSISIRNNLVPGDLGYLIHLHGSEYGREFGYGIEFEMYVAETVAEFYHRYDPLRDRVWICEHDSRMIGTLVLMHREKDTAQLRYFFIRQDFRGLGLGKKLLALALTFLEASGYRSVYLLTTAEQERAGALYTRLGFVLTRETDSTTFGKLLKERQFNLALR
jgi:peptidyl-dipeptidase Dcp